MDVCGFNNSRSQTVNMLYSSSTLNEAFDECGIKLHPSSENEGPKSTHDAFRAATTPLDHETFDGRFKTFKLWPKCLQHLLQELCSAGFYYSNVGDIVKCYKCGGQISEWDLNDDPWQEHARFYPDCLHVINVKSSKLIKNALELNKWV